MVSWWVFIIPGAPYGTEKLAQIEFWYAKNANEHISILQIKTSTFFFGNLFQPCWSILYLWTPGFGVFHWSSYYWQSCMYIMLNSLARALAVFSLGCHLLPSPFGNLMAGEGQGVVVSWAVFMLCCNFFPWNSGVKWGVVTPETQRIGFCQIFFHKVGVVHSILHE